MRVKSSIFHVLLFSTILLLIPASSFSSVNAQEYENDYYYNNNDSYYQEIYDENTNTDYSSLYDKTEYMDSADNFYYYPDRKDKEFIKLVQECEDCFFSELVKLDRKIADKILKIIDKKFESLTNLCKLIASEQIDREKLERILDKILNSPEFVDKNKVKKFFKDFETRSSTNYNLDEFKLKDKRIDAKSLQDFKENVLECIFPPDNVYTTFIEGNEENGLDAFIAVSNDNGLTFNTINLSIAGPDGPTDADDINPPVVSGNNVYVTWKEEDNTTNEEDAFIAVSNDNGLTFNTINLSIADPGGPTDVDDINPPVVSGSNVYVSWDEDEDDTTDEKDAFIAVSNDNGLTFNTINLSIADPGGPTNVDIIHPPVVSGSNVYVTWDEDEDDTITDDDAFIAVSNDNGLTFNTINLSIEKPNVPTDVSGINPPVVSGSNVYVTWEENEDDITTDDDAFIAVSNDNGLTFNTINLSIADPDGTTNANSIQPAIISGNNVYVAWTEEEDAILGGGDVFIAVSNDNGLTFNTINLSVADPGGPTSTSGGLDLPVVSRSNVYVTWEEDEDNTTPEEDAFIAVSNDNGLTFTTINLSVADPGGPTDTDNLSSPVVSGNNVYVTWTENEDNTTDEKDAFIAVSNDNGLTFNTINLSIVDPGGPTDADDINPPVVSGNNVYVTWQEDEDDAVGEEDAFIAVSNDNGLTFTTINLSVADPGGPTTANTINPPVVSGNNVYVTWQEDEDDAVGEGDAFIAVSNDNGLTFTTINLSVADPGGPTDTDNISSPVVSGSNVYVTWLEQEDDTTNADDAFIAVSNDNGLTFNTINLSVADPGSFVDNNSEPVVS